MLYSKAEKNTTQPETNLAGADDKEKVHPHTQICAKIIFNASFRSEYFEMHIK